jgi:hypothetical protein
MVDLAEMGVILQTISVMSAATAAVIGVRSYINANKRAEEAKHKEQETRDRELQTRQAQMFMNIYNQLTTKDFGAALNLNAKSHYMNYSEFNELMQKEDFQEAFTIIGMYWEGIGVLVKEKFLDIRLVALMLCGNTRFFWEKLKPFVDEARVNMGYERWMSETEYLYNELLKYLDEHPELSTEFKKWGGAVPSS